MAKILCKDGKAITLDGKVIAINDSTTLSSEQNEIPISANDDNE